MFLKESHIVSRLNKIPIIIHPIITTILLRYEYALLYVMFWMNISLLEIILVNIVINKIKNVFAYNIITTPLTALYPLIF